MTTHTFNYTLFQAQFPAYASSPSQAVLQQNFNVATNFVDPNDNFCGGLNNASLDYALNCLTAHITYLNGLIAAGQDTVVVTASGIDKISVSLLAPPVKSMFQYWLMTSPYGKMLAALLRVQFGAGFYASKGLPERQAFRKVGGSFR